MGKPKSANLIRTVRWKFLLVFLGSVSLTAFIMLLGRLLAGYLLSEPPYNGLLIWTVNNIGSKPIMIVTGIVSFILFYFLFSRPIIRYLNEITDGLQEIAKGQFDYVIPVKSSDEIGSIAYRVNALSEELNSYLQEITFGLQEIAKGQFEHVIPVKPANDLGLVAESINHMSAQLYHSIQEERNAEKTKNDLITGVSHDLRTPLTSILGFLELIENDRYHDEVELRYYVNIAYEKALSLKYLIDDLFEFTRINNGLPLELTELDMTNFIRQLAEEFVPSLEKAGMMCRINAPSEPLYIMADGDRLVRSYENLISNAIQYGKSGKYVDIELGKEEDQIYVKVTNYGEPISERDLPYIFDRFYRAEQSRSKETGGTGLGLAITKSIIEVHGGKISAASDRNKTTFTTRFPSA
ncbi:histidine kinase [Paenibacillus dendritiformis]|uniref:sensor histidine kinase n=1 Tax=Paenibacillus dendritiformis TaxID=130049 RepID=UPI0018CDB58C|nr:HAMP domain-containing sensor histidine kinase [Paenibacillus dendritiformis]MBG9793518.1 histidine kinase [Paenibacillus dendritiformis]